MCSVPVIEFFIQNITFDEISGKRILEVGSKYVNGSVKPLLQLFKPAEYVGVDKEPGKNVDLVLPAEELSDHFGLESFDVVISTELIEHVLDWRQVINNMKSVLRPNGIMWVTTRSLGFPYHAHPFDFWRYELEDFHVIFSDFTIEKLERDNLEPGVFAKFIKPSNWTAANLSKIKLYSMAIQKRTDKIPS